jgi:hypothetical protein
VPRQNAVRRPLLRVQQNTIYTHIKARHLNPADFGWSEEATFPDGSGDIGPVITYRPGGQSFKFGFSGERRRLFWNPPLHNSRTEGEARDWSDVWTLFSAWLSQVAQDQGAPDLWGALRSEHAIVDATVADATDNRPFDTRELAELASRLTELQAYVETNHVHSAPERAQVASRIRYVRDAARRGLGRIDWLNIFVAQMVAMVISGLVPADAYGDVMRFAAGLLSGLVETIKTLTQ